jgi:hypothetical protein
MSNIGKSMWRRANVSRVVIVAGAVAIGTFLLLLLLCSLGDTDLPPYDPPFLGERAGWKVLGVIAWPLVLVDRIVGHDPPAFLWLPLLFVAGLFWALLIEGCILMKYARKA